MGCSRGDVEQAKKVQSVGLGHPLGVQLGGAGDGGAWVQFRQCTSLLGSCQENAVQIISGSPSLFLGPV